MHCLTAIPPSTDGAARLAETALAIHTLRRTGEAGRFVSEALAITGRAIAFRRAWWGLCSTPEDGQPPAFLHFETLGIPQGLFARWLPHAAQDPFARQVLHTPGVAHVFRGYGATEAPLVRLAQEFDLYHGLSTCQGEPMSGHMLFLVLYRGQADTAFSGEEAQLLLHVFAFIARFWHSALQDIVASDADASTGASGIAWPDGRVLHAEGALALALARDGATAQGKRLPPELLPDGHDGAREALLGMLRVRAELREGLVHVTATPAAGSPLSPREMRVARLFAAGQSYKEIARALDLSPATVRTYLRMAYLRTGVRNKVALGAALNDKPALEARRARS